MRYLLLLLIFTACAPQQAPTVREQWTNDFASGITLNTTLYQDTSLKVVGIYLDNPRRNSLKIWLKQVVTNISEIVTRERRVYLGNDRQINKAYKLSPLEEGARETITVVVRDDRNRELLKEEVK